MATLPTATITEALVRALYQDLKTWAVTRARHLGEARAIRKAREFPSPRDFMIAAENGELDSGQAVKVRCKPAPIGAFLSSHFLSPTVGSHTSMRRGPPILSDNPVFGILAQASSHLTPVGFFPPVSPGIDQLVLYPPDSPACGFLSLLPMVREMVLTVPGLASSDLAPHYFKDVRLTGRARFLDSGTMAAAGFSPEEYEAVRSAGRIWFLDLTEESTKAEILGDGGDLWGGLYAVGHLEFDGSLPVQEAVDVLATSMEAFDFNPEVSQNLAGAHEVMIFSEGFRCHLATHAPIYSFHMDVEFTREFSDSKRRFDGVIDRSLEGIQAAMTRSGAELRNPRDIDFSYSDSTSAYSILRSASAEQISDPLAIALRDWHRLRVKSKE